MMIHVCFKQNSCCMVHLSPCGLSICEWGRGKGGGVKEGLLYPHQIPLKITCVPDRDKIFLCMSLKLLSTLRICPVDRVSDGCVCQTRTQSENIVIFILLMVFITSIILHVVWYTLLLYQLLMITNK